MQTTDYLANSSNEVLPTAITRLIDAAVASFDTDPDAARRYLVRASALLGVGRGARRSQSAGQSASRGGLLSWQLNRVVDYIEMHLPDKITATNLAALLNMSMGSLFRAFKTSVGVTPFQYIATRRVELACTMMRTTREPLSRIAVGCGLCDQAHLCRIFRNIVGMTPSAWRRATLDYVSPGVFPASRVSRAPNAQLDPRSAWADPPHLTAPQI
jgi:AraC family transcriptional regulator